MIRNGKSFGTRNLKLLFTTKFTVIVGRERYKWQTTTPYKTIPWNQIRANIKQSTHSLHSINDWSRDISLFAGVDPSAHWPGSTVCPNWYWDSSSAPIQMVLHYAFPKSPGMWRLRWYKFTPTRCFTKWNNSVTTIKISLVQPVAELLAEVIFSCLFTSSLLEAGWWIPFFLRLW